MELCVARQPIFDRRLNVFAYELLFRSGMTNRFDGTEANLATAKVISSIFYSANGDNILGGKPAFIIVAYDDSMKRLLPLLVWATFACSGRMVDQLHETPASEAESRIQALSGRFSQLLSQTPKEQQLRAACKVNCAQVADELDSINAERLAAMDAVASQIHAAVDRYVTRTVSPKTLGSARPRIESGLKHILTSAADMQPAAFGLNSAGGHTLIVVYSLQKGGMMGPGATSVTLRAYRAKGNRVELVDAIGSDMDGYGGVSVKVLRSPVLGDAWFLVSGNMTGANGPNVRMRVYVCNSGKFRTMWMPANVWGTFTVNLTDGARFTIEGPYYREDKKRCETYALAPDGLYLVRPVIEGSWPTCP
jgi:hypothetical protein